LHVGNEEDVWCNRILFEDWASDTCTGRVYYSGSKAPEVKKTTNIRSPNSGDSVLKAAINPPVSPQNLELAAIAVD